MNEVEAAKHSGGGTMTLYLCNACDEIHFDDGSCEKCGCPSLREVEEGDI